MIYLEQLASRLVICSPIFIKIENSSRSLTTNPVWLSWNRGNTQPAWYYSLITYFNYTNEKINTLFYFQSFIIFKVHINIKLNYIRIRNIFQISFNLTVSSLNDLSIKLISYFCYNWILFYFIFCKLWNCIMNLKIINQKILEIFWFFFFL